MQRIGKILEHRLAAAEGDRLDHDGVFVDECRPSTGLAFTAAHVDHFVRTRCEVLAGTGGSS